MITKKSCLYDTFFETKYNFIIEHVKFVNNSRFLFKTLGSSRFFFQNLSISRFLQVFFCLNCQTLGFSNIPGFFATLVKVKTKTKNKVLGENCARVAVVSIPKLNNKI